MLKYMLDTHICIFTSKNKPSQVREAFECHHEQMCISTMTLMELVYGAETSAFPQRNLAVIERLVARMQVLDYNAKAAGHTGQLRAELQKPGKTIGAYDFQIAGHARSLGLILVTNNLREFERVPGLRVEDWVHPL
jgi:tRNA(fMet)-specific endonuclease VapC